MINSTTELVSPVSPFPSVGQKGVAATDDLRASQAACQVLKEGGNAVDAAITASLMLGVTCPQYTGIGGGGILLVWEPGASSPRMLDYREVAPGGVSPDWFSDEESSITGGKTVGVPGSIAGLWELHEQFGKLPWKRYFEPCVELADKGFAVYPNYVRTGVGRHEDLLRYPASAKIFCREDGTPKGPGDRLVQADLAKTYAKIAAEGKKGFYEGSVAEAIVRSVQEDGGCLSLKDLANYEVVWREPLQSSYRGYQVFTTPPPSGGGLQLLQMLAMLEPFDLSDMDYLSAPYFHLLTEAMRISYAERVKWIADPAFFQVPTEHLLDPEHLMKLHLLIDPTQSSEFLDLPSLDWQPDAGYAMPGIGGTSSFAVVDEEGWMVVGTESVNLWFGSAVVAEGTGIVLNDIMDDFTRNPGLPDSFGLVGSKINQIEPGKRAASSCCPSLVAKNGMPVMALGSAGGPKIPTSILHMLSYRIDHGCNVAQSIALPRVHHQWLPNHCAVEPFVAEDTRRELRRFGHDVVQEEARSHAVMLGLEPSYGGWTGFADLRSGGQAWSVEDFG